MKNYFYFSLLFLCVGVYLFLTLEKNTSNVDAILIDFNQPMDVAYKFSKDSMPSEFLLCKTVLNNKTYYFESYGSNDLIISERQILCQIGLFKNRFMINHFNTTSEELNKDFVEYETPELLLIDFKRLADSILQKYKYLEIDISWVGTTKENKERVITGIMEYIKDKNNEFSFKKYKREFELLTKEERGSKDYSIDVLVFKLSPPPFPSSSRVVD